MKLLFTDPEAVVQRQLDAYNAHDIDTLIDIYADDAQQFEHPMTLLARGSTQMRERFVVRFQEPNVFARLVNRMVMGSIVIDHEIVTRTFPEGAGRIEMIAMYEVHDARIANAWFIFGKKTLDG